MKRKKLVEVFCCNKCLHEWSSKMHPRMCPSCKTVKWNDLDELGFCLFSAMDNFPEVGDTEGIHTNIIQDCIENFGGYHATVSYMEANPKFRKEIAQINSFFLQEGIVDEPMSFEQLLKPFKK